MIAPALILLALLAAPVEPAEPLPDESLDEPVIHAAGWCAIRGEDDAAPGCDVGLGVALVRRGRAAWVAVVGAETIGTGAAWTVNPDRLVGRPLIAVAIGVVAELDGQGVGTELYPAIGATLSFGGRP